MLIRNLRTGQWKETPKGKQKRQRRANLVQRVEALEQAETKRNEDFRSGGES